jgi:hypothetical protein
MAVNIANVPATPLGGGAPTVGGGLNVSGGVLSLGDSTAANFTYDSTNHRIGFGQASPECVIQANSSLGAITFVGAASASSVISLQSGAGTFPGLFFGSASGSRGQLYWDDGAGIQLTATSGILNLNGASATIITGTQIQLKPASTLVLFATSVGIFGTSGASGNLNLGSTSNATKGLINFGAGGVGMVYDETNKRLGIGASTTPGTTLTLFAASGGTTWLQSQVSGANAVGRFQINTTVGDFEMRANRSLATELGQASVFSVLTSTGTAGPMALGTAGATDLLIVTNGVLALTVDNATSRVKIAAAGITANGSGAVTAPGSIGPSAIAVQAWWTVKDSAGNTRYVPLYG